MTPEPDARDELFKAFARAFFKQDLDAMYGVVTEDFTYSILVNDEPRIMNTRDQVEAFFAERKGTQTGVRFEDVVYHHAPEASFMTYRVTGTDTASGEQFERVGVERYTFRDGRIAEKDVYSRPNG
ncbi:MAG: nuclear transport factor 2 family protein [Actinomycetota bacterium]